MEDSSRIEAHDPSTRHIYREEIVRSDEFPQEPRLALHRSVFIEPIGGVNDSEPSLDQLRDKREFSIQFLVLKQAEVRGITTPKVLQREAHGRHCMYF